MTFMFYYSMPLENTVFKKFRQAVHIRKPSNFKLNQWIKYTFLIYLIHIVHKNILLFSIKNHEAIKHIYIFQISILRIVWTKFTTWKIHSIITQNYLKIIYDMLGIVLICKDKIKSLCLCCYMIRNKILNSQDVTLLCVCGMGSSCCTGQVITSPCDMPLCKWEKDTFLPWGLIPEPQSKAWWLSHNCFLPPNCALG